MLPRKTPVAALAFLLVLSLEGCGPAGVTARDVLDASAIVGRASEESLAASHRAAERECLDLESTDAAASCLDRTEADFAARWAVYAGFLAAWRLGDAAERAGAADALPRALAADRSLTRVR